MRLTKGSFKYGAEQSFGKRLFAATERDLSALKIVPRDIQRVKGAFSFCASVMLLYHPWGQKMKLREKSIVMQHHYLVSWMRVITIRVTYPQELGILTIKRCR